MTNINLEVNLFKVLYTMIIQGSQNHSKLDFPGPDCTVDLEASWLSPGSWCLMKALLWLVSTERGMTAGIMSGFFCYILLFP